MPTRRWLSLLVAVCLAFVAGCTAAGALDAQPRPGRWRFLSDTTANTTAGGWRFEPLPDSGVAPYATLDSVLAARGCTRQPFAVTGVDPLDRVLFDSAGIRVIEPASAAGYRRPVGRAPYWVRCPGPDLILEDSVATARNRRGFGYARLGLYDADSLHAGVTPGRYRRVWLSTLDRSGPLPPHDVELAEDTLGLLEPAAYRVAAPRIASRLRADAPAVYDAAVAAANSATPGWRPTLGPLIRADEAPPPVVVVPPVADSTRYRLTVLARRDSANSVQLADLVLIDSAGARLAWPAGTRAEALGTSPADEGPAAVLDTLAATKWLDFSFAGADTARRGRSQLTVIRPGVPPAITGWAWRTGNDYPARDPVTTVLELSRDGTNWTRLDSVTALPTTDRGAWVLRRWASTLPPVVVAPPIAPVDHPCTGFPLQWIDQPDVRLHDVERRDEARVVSKAGACVGVAVYRRTSDGDRWAVYYPPCTPGAPWRLFGTVYSTRTGAVDRAARGLACPTP